MVGRITTVDPALNEHGVPYSRVLEEHLAAHTRLTGAMAEALKRWLAADEAKKGRKPVKVQIALLRAAREATEMALS